MNVAETVQNSNQNTPFDYLCWLLIACFLAFIFWQVLKFVIGVIRGTIDFLELYSRHRKSLKTPLEAGQLWSDGRFFFRITHVLGKDGAEGVCLEVPFGPRSIVAQTMTRPEWESTCKSRMMFIVRED